MHGWLVAFAYVMHFFESIIFICHYIVYCFVKITTNQLKCEKVSKIEKKSKLLQKC